MPLNHPEPGSRQLETRPVAQSPLTVLKPSKPKLFPLARLAFSMQKHNKSSWPCFPLAPVSTSWPNLVLPHMALHSMASSLLLETIRNKFFFQSIDYSMSSLSCFYKLKSYMYYHWYRYTARLPKLKHKGEYASHLVLFSLGCSLLKPLKACCKEAQANWRPHA